MRACDRDLIRGGHYGQRPCVPHLKAEHMAAPTKTANVKKALANSEPSTHGTPFGRLLHRRRYYFRAFADVLSAGDEEYYDHDADDVKNIHCVLRLRHARLQY
jgi:hypothetical protein